jgi:ribosomal protein L29
MSTETDASSLGSSSLRIANIIRRKPVASGLTPTSNGHHFSNPSNKPARWQPGRIIINKIVHNPLRNREVPSLEETNTAIGNANDGFNAIYTKHMDTNSLSPMFKDSGEKFQAGLYFSEFMKSEGRTPAELTRDEIGNLGFRKQGKSVNWDGPIQSTWDGPQKKVIKVADEDRLTGWTDEDAVIKVPPRTLDPDRSMNCTPLAAGVSSASAKAILTPRKVPMGTPALKQPNSTGPQSFGTPSDRLIAIHPHPNDSFQSPSPQLSHSDNFQLQDSPIGARKCLKYKAEEATRQAKHANLLAEQARGIVRANQRYLGVQESKDKEEERLKAHRADLLAEQKRLRMKKKQRQVEEKTVRILEAVHKLQSKPAKVPQGKSKHELGADSSLSGAPNLLEVFLYGVGAALIITILVGLLKR